MKKNVKAVRYDELEGKTVSGAGFSWGEMLIAFTDGTVLALSAQDSGDGDGTSVIDFEQSEINVATSRWAAVANEAGVLTDDEYKAVMRKRDAELIGRLENELAYLKREK